MENTENNERVLRVRADTDCSKLSGSIISAYEEDEAKPIILRAIGAGAINQAIKSAATSNHHFSKRGLCVLLAPSFKVVDGGITAIELKIHLKKN